MSVNIFEILGMEKRETAYSNFLSWLLTQKVDSSKNNTFLRCLLSLLDEDLSLSNSSIDVDREDGKNDCVADIVVKGEDFLIVIENKVTASEGTKQTKKLYENWGGSEKNEIFVYLTPEYRERPECDKFEHITYSQIRDILKDLDYTDYDRRVRIVIEDFIEVLRKNQYVRFDGLSDESREYMKSPETSQNKNKLKIDVEHLFKEVRRLLEDDEKISSDSSWKVDNKRRRIVIHKENWDNGSTRIECKLHDGHIQKGFVRFGVYSHYSVDNRNKKWEEFKSHFDSLQNSTERKWSFEEDSVLFNKILEGDENIPLDIKKKLMNYIEDYEEVLDKVTQ